MNAEQMRDALYPTKEACNGSACASCMRINDPNEHLHLLTCSACKLVKYCDRNCQRRDWKSHKPVCKVLQAFKVVSTGDGIPEEHLQHKVGRDRTILKFKLFKRLMTGGSADGVGHGSDGNDTTKDSEDVNAAVHRRELAKILQLPDHISDKSWDIAEHFVFMHRCCSICKRSEYNDDDDDASAGTGITWRNCPKCNYGWCCAEHFEEYQPMHTPEICKTYIESAKMNRFRYNHTFNHGDNFLLVPQDALSTPLKRFPKDWDEYYQIRCPMELSMKHQLPEEFFPAGTYQLSQVTTCLNGMYKHDKDFFTTTKHLEIHVVGAAPQFELEGGGPTYVWEEIMHCLPSVQTMNISYIGPECPQINKMGLECCPDCIGKGRSRTAAFFKNTYHEFYEGNKGDGFIKPNFVLAYNTGMYEEYTESWKESLEVMLDLDVLCLFTSYNQNEAVADFAVLGEVNARTLTTEPVKNPFAGNFPVIDLSAVDKFFQTNMYSVCFKGRNT